MNSNYKNNKKEIFFFDSCAGGFGVMKPFLKWAGNYNITFVADYKKNPFGIKSEKNISSIVTSWFENYICKLEKRDIKLIVIACNTASIASMNIIDTLIQNYKIPILTMIDGLKASLSNNIQLIKNQNVGIFGTKYTIESNIYYKFIKNNGANKIFNIIGTKSEAAIAKGFYQEEKGDIDITNELKYFKKFNINTIILGCTCFELIQNQIQRVLGKDVKFINPSFFVSEKAKKTLNVKEVSEVDINSLNIISTKLNKESINGLNKSSNSYFGCQLDLSEIII